MSSHCFLFGNSVTYKDLLVSSKTVEIVYFQKKTSQYVVLFYFCFATPSGPNDGGQVLPREASHQFHGATCHISQEVRIVVSF